MKSLLRYTLFSIGAVFVFAILCLCTVVAFILISSDKYIYKDTTNAPSAQAALILGAAVLRNGGLSPVLRDRADQAIELYESGKVTHIIASGNNASREYDEVGPMQIYLEAHHIPSEAILLDRAGIDTYSSISRAQSVFSIESLAIISQSFHLPRAVFIARSLGIDAFGVSADRGHYKFNNYIREIGADIKAMRDVLFKRVPFSLE